jgi:D-alanine-D-alanine ligase
MKVAVLSGGRSSEHEISLMSGQAVTEGLRQAGHEVVNVVIGSDGRWSCEGAPVSIVPGEGLVGRAADGGPAVGGESGHGTQAGPDLTGVEVAFPALHGPFGEDGVTQGALDTAGLPYVGSPVLGSAVCMDKLTLKRLCADFGIAQVDFVQAPDPDQGEGETGPGGGLTSGGTSDTGDWRQRALAMEWPLWVKPARLGSSVGITRVERPEDLDAAVAEAGEHDPRVIIEANCSGREVECSVLGNLAPETSLPGQIIADAEWYDFEAKYTEGRMSLEVPAQIGESTTAELRNLAAEVFRLADCSGLARCDFFVEEDGRVLLNEVNTMPGFTKTSVYAKLWEASGLPYPELCSRLIELAVERHRREAAHSF